MGNRFGRGREAPVGNAEAAATEQKTAAEPAAEPAATPPAVDRVISQIQETIKTEILEVVTGESTTPKPCLPSEECVMDTCAASDPLTDAEPEPVAKETPAPVQPEPLVSVSESSAPESEPAAEPKPVAEAQLAPAPEEIPASEPVPEPEAFPEPEQVPEPEAFPEPEQVPEPEAFPEPISVSLPTPADALELLSHESLPEPVIPSLSLVDLGVPDVTPQPIDIPPITASVNADEPSDIPVTSLCQDSVEVSVIPICELEMSEETSESLEMEVEAAANLEQLVSDANEESVCGLLKNLELRGNELVADLIPADVKIPDDMSTSTELM